MKNGHQHLVSIVLLNFNGRTLLGELLDKCVDSILNTQYPNFELIFVDNGSTDNSAEYIQNGFNRENLKVIKLQRNFGFSRGNNIGANSSKGDIIVFVNSDVIVDKNWLIPLVAALEKSNVGLVYPDVNPPGSCMALRRDTFLQLNGFDERYFLYHEDTDIITRVKLAGYHFVRVNNSRVWHKHGGTIKKLGDVDFPAFEGWRSAFIFFCKFAKPGTLVLTTSLLLCLNFMRILFYVKNGLKLYALGSFKWYLWLLLHIQQIVEIRKEANTAFNHKVSDRFAREWFRGFVRGKLRKEWKKPHDYSA